LSIARASVLEWKATARIFGPWLPGACVLGCVATWLQEPLFFRDYGINLLWDGGLAAMQLEAPLVALVWCMSRAQASGWRRVVRSDPTLAVLSGGIGLLGYGVFILLIIVVTNTLMELTYGTRSLLSHAQGYALGWLLPALPLSLLAPGLSFVRLPAAASLLLWLAAAGLCLGFTPPRYDYPVPLAMVGASASAAIGSMLLSLWLVRVTR
jgi:hypothetical protein